MGTQFENIGNETQTLQIYIYIYIYVRVCVFTYKTCNPFEINTVKDLTLNNMEIYVRNQSQRTPAQTHTKKEGGGRV